MKTYKGIRELNGVVVTVDGQPLPQRQDLRNHSPDGFEWGYAGSGPAQLALALLADHSQDDSFALAHYQQFKNLVIASLPDLKWSLSSACIDAALKRLDDSPHPYSTIGDVPCNNCTLCCHMDIVRLLPGDPTNLQVERHPYLPGHWMLAHKPNGDCWYLGPTGCTIHKNRPQMCREMDCRMLSIAADQNKLPKKGNFNHDVFAKGRDLQKQYPIKFTPPCPNNPIFTK